MTSIGYCDECRQPPSASPTAPALYMHNDKRICIADCPEKFYADTGTKSCESCLDENCKTCTNNTHCVKCSPTYLLSADKTSCLTECPIATFEKDGECVPCSASCKVCTNEYVCKECYAPNLVMPTYTCGMCIVSNGYIEDGFYCKACHESCKTCRGVAKNNCVTCHIGHELSVRESCLPLNAMKIKVKSRSYNPLKQIF